MRKRYSMADAQRQLPAIVRDAEHGALVELTRSGQPVAVVLSIAEHERLSRPRQNFWTSLLAWRARHDLADINVDEIFESARGRIRP